MTPRRLTAADLAKRLGVSRRTLYNWTDAGRVPKPHYLCGQRRWWLHEIEAWEQAQGIAPERKAA